MEKIEIFFTGEENISPRYQSEGSAGADLYALTEEPIRLKPMERVLVPTGLAIALPMGYEAQIRPRSGLAYKQGLTVLNSPGTIDSDYRGEIKILLINLGSEEIVINSGDRIAQMVVAPYVRGNFILCDSLETTQRGQGGFGSTGI